MLCHESCYEARAYAAAARQLAHKHLLCMVYVQAICMYITEGREVYGSNTCNSLE